MGVTYYSLLVGRLPVETQSIRELVRFHTSRMGLDIDAATGELPGGVVDILRRALAATPTERYENSGQLYDDLSATFGSLRPLRALLREAFRGTSVDVDEHDKRFEVRVPLPNGRRQTVHVEIGQDAETGESVVRAFSICGRATDHYYERALQLNATISHGSVAIQSIDGEPHFVMVNAYPRATCDPEEIRKSVFEIAKHSDEVERLLSDKDRY
jgi:hypothetical protein